MENAKISITVSKATTSSPNPKQIQLTDRNSETGSIWTQRSDWNNQATDLRYFSPSPAASAAHLNSSLLSSCRPSPPQMWPVPLLRLLFMNGEDALTERLWLGLEGWHDVSRHGDRGDTQTAGDAIFTLCRFSLLDPLRSRENPIFLYF